MRTSLKYTEVLHVQIKAQKYLRYVGGNVIKPSEKVCNLGVILDQTLIIRNLLSFDACATLIHALIGSRLDYCNLLLYNVADAKVERSQKVQNQAASILTRSPHRDHITPVLQQLHWLKVRERIRYKVLILAQTSFYETAPQYLSALVTKKDYVKNTRSSNDHYLLCTPPLSKDFSRALFSFFCSSRVEQIR